MSDRLNISLANDLAELPSFWQRLDAFGARNRLPSDVVFAVKLALEELVTNTILYGYADDDAHTIEVNLNLDDEVLRATIVDDAAAFDPRNATEPDLTSPLAERPIGGLGVHLVKNLMDGIDYRRDGERNRITLTKRTEG